jgi:cytoskeletal protein RodZ
MNETSELLKKTRTDRNLSLEEISSQTKIQLHILRALEEGDLSEFRSPTYTRGFLRQYSKALGLDPEAVVRMFEQEHLGTTNNAQKATPVAKLDDNEIQNKTNVLWFRTSSQLLNFGGVFVIFMLVTAIYFFSMKLASYSQETRNDSTPSSMTSDDAAVAAATTEAEEPLAKEESLSLPQKPEPTPAVDDSKKQDKKAAPAAAVEPARPKMVTVEAFETVEINAVWSTGKKEDIKLKTNGKHVFYYADKLKLDISNGGGVGITTHEKEMGVPGELGKSKTLNFD